MLVLLCVLRYTTMVQMVLHFTKPSLFRRRVALKLPGLPIWERIATGLIAVMGELLLLLNFNDLLPENKTDGDKDEEHRSR